MIPEWMLWVGGYLLGMLATWRIMWLTVARGHVHKPPLDLAAWLLIIWPVGLFAVCGIVCQSALARSFNRAEEIRQRRIAATDVPDEVRSTPIPHTNEEQKVRAGR